MPAPRRPNQWLLYALAAVALLGLGAWADWRSAAPPDALAKATYVGADACVACHQVQHQDWLGSHHDLAMQVASEATVLADFDNATHERLGVTTRFFRDGDRFLVNTEGPTGEFADFEVKYTFGVEPLQQYLVELPGGRLQTLRVSWDTEKQRWFYVNPPDVVDERIRHDDPLHWTGISQNWNSTCAECHSTNLQKNYDPSTGEYDTTWSEIDVSCEECHGPASLHVELASAASMFWDRRHGYGLAKLKSADSSIEIEACAKCHSRRTAVHEGFRPGEPLLDYFEPSPLLAGLYHADGQILDEVYVYGSFMQSKMHARGVRCSDCHNPHSLKLEKPGNLMCAKCHEAARYDVVAHHHHPDPRPGEASVGSQCVECHMPAKTYMVVDPRRDHSLRVPRPDLSVSTGAPNACNNCHQGEAENAEWAAAKVAEWFAEDGDTDSSEIAPGTIGEWASGNWPPGDWHWAPAISAGRQALPEGQPLLIDVAQRETAPAIVRATAVHLLQQYDDPAVRETIDRLLQANDPILRLAAVRATLPDPRRQQSTKLLIERLEDPSRAVRTEAARQLVVVPESMLTREQLRARNAGVADFRERQALTAERAASHMTLSNLEADLGEFDAAIEQLRTATELEPYLSGPRGRLAELLEQQNGDPKEVDRLRREEVDLLTRDTGFLPDQSDIHYRLGLLKYKLQDAAGAEASLARAVQLSPGNYSYLLALALLQEERYRQTGEQEHFDSATETLERMNELDPDNPAAVGVLRRMIELRNRLQTP